MKSKYYILERRIYNDGISFLLDNHKEITEKDAIKLIKNGNILNAVVVKSKDGNYVRGIKGSNIQVHDMKNKKLTLKNNNIQLKQPKYVSKKKSDNYFRRKLYDSFLEWKNINDGTVLYLKGPRQVGKTYLLKKFARENFKNVVYINLADKNDKFLNIYHKMLEYNLTDSENDRYTFWYNIFCNYDTNYKDGDDTLVIIDEIQESTEIYSSIRDFHLYVNARVAVSGSYLGITQMSNRYFLPAGDITTFEMMSLSYEEFLDAFDLLEEYNKIKSVDKTSLSIDELKIYNEVEKLYNLYMEIGGYPSVIEVYKNTHDIDKSKYKIKEILDVFYVESRRYFSTIISDELFKKTFHSLAYDLITRTNKYGYSDLKDIYFRDNDYDNFVTKKDKTECLRWLISSGFIGICNIYDSFNYSFSKDNKYYFLDMGILNYYLNDLNISKSIKYGIQTENFVFIYLYNNTLYRNLNKGLFNNSSVYSLETTVNNTKLEIDYIIKTFNNKIIAIEVKHKNGKVISSEFALKDNKINYIIKLTDTYGGLSKDGKKYTIPLFAITKLRDLLNII